MISYRPLFVLLAEKNMKKTDLLQVISSPTLAKLSKGEVIKSDIIEKLCLFLRCQPGDIMEITEVESVPGGSTIVTMPVISRDAITDELIFEERKHVYNVLEDIEYDLFNPNDLKK